MLLPTDEQGRAAKKSLTRVADANILIEFHHSGIVQQLEHPLPSTSLTCSLLCAIGHYGVPRVY